MIDMNGVLEEEDLLACAGMAPWESRAGGTVVWSAAAALMVGLDVPAMQPLATFLEQVHPGDRARLAEHLGHDARLGHFSLSFRVSVARSGIRWLTLRGSVLDTAGDEPPFHQRGPGFSKS